MDGKFIYNVEYHKKGKPNGKRSLHVIADDYEEVLWTHVLKMLCEKVHGHDFLFIALKEKDVIRNKSNNIIAEYTVTFRDRIDTTYIVNMEVIGERGILK
ncbi:hypothetical protein [Maribacter sp. Hel_I_7]|uniref:hypothetical protein n=1 Tax=Maribacter sp. Hel_I_7 TaxID=1249997 RepID=UPI00047A303D|nr:hypothetical protein [Maribacter sp. Hel_I_7]